MLYNAEGPATEKLSNYSVELEVLTVAITKNYIFLVRNTV
jgi:hypothetical protein